VISTAEVVGMIAWIAVVVGVTMVAGEVLVATVEDRVTTAGTVVAKVVEMIVAEVIERVVGVDTAHLRADKLHRETHPVVLGIARLQAAHLEVDEVPRAVGAGTTKAIERELVRAGRRMNTVFQLQSIGPVRTGQQMRSHQSSGKIPLSLMAGSMPQLTSSAQWSLHLGQCRSWKRTILAVTELTFLSLSRRVFRKAGS